MEKQILESAAAPAPVASYSQAVRAGDFVFCSGQIPIDPATHELVEGDIQRQTARVLDNLGAVLGSAGLTHEDIVKCTVFLADLADFASFDMTYAAYFRDRPPARATVQVAGLPRGARVEIEAIAHAPR